MNIIKSINADTVTLGLYGRLDTVTSSQLAHELNSIFDDKAVNLIFDFTALEYISSAGLRVLLTAQKKVNALGTKMKINGANEMIKEVFNITGFSGIIEIN